MPMVLTLIEAIGGREKAEAVARDLGLTHWDARHDSDAFAFIAARYRTPTADFVAMQLEYPTPNSPH